MSTKQRRRRVVVCIHCGFLFQAQRASPGDEHALQSCPQCYVTFTLAGAKTWLEGPKQTAGSAA